MQTEARVPGFEFVAVNSKGVGRELPGLDPAWEYTDPVLSPDRKHIALTALPLRTGPGRGPAAPASKIVVYKLPSGPAILLEGPGQNRLPAWVGNTGKISFLRRADSNDVAIALVVRNADGTGNEQVVLAGESNTVMGVAWNPSGTEFLLAHHGTPVAPRGEIVQFKMSNLALREQFYRTAMLPGRPVSNPDGSMIAFVGSVPRTSSTGSVTPSVDRRIYVMSVATRNSTVASASGDYPTWSADGRTLFFLSTSTRRIYRARIRPGSTPRADAAVAVSEPFEVPSSPFAALPGDSLFLVRRRHPIPATVDVPPALRGVSADVATQKALELVAARALVPLMPEREIYLNRVALESRSYITLPDALFAGFAQEIKSYLLPGRDSAHFAALADILKTRGVVTDASAAGCPVSTMVSQCRMGSHEAVLDFSPAVVSADSARLYAHAWIGAGAVTTGTPVGILHRWTLTFMRSDTGWIVKRVE